MENQGKKLKVKGENRVKVKGNILEINEHTESKVGESEGDSKNYITAIPNEAHMPTYTTSG